MVFLFDNTNINPLQSGNQAFLALKFNTFVQKQRLYLNLGLLFVRMCAYYINGIKKVLFRSNVLDACLRGR
ncbi:hypothetical protein HCH_06983 [Hahella chejuensis KCTC 2396]|uniref:Uncharacterized protein n=1 Tax=Hahella chejuensis (strain KCTC 2396) TaxID=349521 RepID=Q2S6X6_HAHCH|nr:hypothetical protein HCH_06983 [Hahella chejuensis KCTC 2396]